MNDSNVLPCLVPVSDVMQCSAVTAGLNYLVLDTR